MALFSTFQLQPERFDEGLPLVRMTLAGIDRTDWRAHCASMVRFGGGVVATAVADGPLHGIASWCPDEDLGLGRVLRVEMIAALELSAANPVRASLCGALERLCADRDAAGILLNLTFRREDLRSPLAEVWKRAGYRPQALFVCRPSPAAGGKPAPAPCRPRLAAVATPD